MEAGEECDCGFNEDECSDHCCYPRVITEVDKMKNNSAQGCHRRKNTQCSPSQGQLIFNASESLRSHILHENNPCYISTSCIENLVKI